jgi:hypothetical protein
MQPWDDKKYPWTGLSIGDVKAVLAAMPKALETLATELQEIAAYELPGKLAQFIK